MKVGTTDHNGQRGDSQPSSAEVPSRRLLTSSPPSANTSSGTMPMPIQTSRCWAARRGDPARADPICTAIGSISSSSPDISGRAGAAEPPHQIRKAPTVNASAANSTPTSSPTRRSGPGRRTIVHRPKPAST